jgi:hypothetical protein
MYRKNGRTYPRINRADDEELAEKIQQEAEADRVDQLQNEEST